MSAALYTKNEERMNVITHAIGMSIFIIALGVLIYLGIVRKSIPMLLGYIVYGLSTIFMFTASTLYHGSKVPQRKLKLRVMDHSAIFVAIAGTYTPICIAVMDGWLRILSLVLVWGLAAFGITMKIIKYVKGKFGSSDKASLVLYLAMGWISVFIVRQIWIRVGAPAVIFLVVGGLAYTVGTFFYRNKKCSYHHGIWHIFVLLGAIAHLMPILIYFK